MIKALPFNILPMNVMITAIYIMITAQNPMHIMIYCYTKHSQTSLVPMLGLTGMVLVIMLSRFSSGMMIFMKPFRSPRLGRRGFTTAHRQTDRKREINK